MPATVLRRILHIDMDAFYASVEQRDDERLRGKPVAVGGDPSQRGVVAAASYEARAFGVHSAMPMSRAVRMCPSLIVVPPDFSKYRSVSQRVFALFRSVTPLVEPLSLDEAYLDVTENAWQEPLGMSVAKRLKTAIREDTQLTASAGVAPNKFLAKIASGWRKPDGLTVIAPERMQEFLLKLPVDRLWGVGPVTAGKLRAQGINTLTDVRRIEVDVLRTVVGSHAEWLRALSFGIDDRPVVPDRAAKSCSTENTFSKDLTDIEAVRSELAAMARQVAGWLVRKRVFARTVDIKVRYADFTTVTRSHTRQPPTQDPSDVEMRALMLLERTEAGRVPVRLLGVGVHGFSDAPEGEPRVDRLPFDSDSTGRRAQTSDP